MRVSIELPDPPAIEPLLDSLNKQYQSVIEQLIGLQRQAQSYEQYRPIIDALAKQQDNLISAFEQMMMMMHQNKEEDHKIMQKTIRQEIGQPQQEASDTLLSAIRGMKKSVSKLPNDLGEIMDQQYKRHQARIIKEKPSQTIIRDSSAKVVAKLDQMESSLLDGLRHSRNRTFGSNY